MTVGLQRACVKHVQDRQYLVVVEFEVLREQPGVNDASGGGALPLIRTPLGAFASTSDGAWTARSWSNSPRTSLTLSLFLRLRRTDDYP